MIELLGADYDIDEAAIGKEEKKEWGRTVDTSQLGFKLLTDAISFSVVS